MERNTKFNMPEDYLPACIPKKAIVFADKTTAKTFKRGDYNIKKKNKKSRRRLNFFNIHYQKVRKFWPNCA